VVGGVVGVRYLVNLVVARVVVRGDPPPASRLVIPIGLPNGVDPVVVGEPLRRQQHQGRSGVPGRR